MKILDLYCCCGGISKGFHDSGHEVTGVDIKDNHNYQYNFIHSDVFKLPVTFFEKFDFIHASPPCQVYTWSTRKDRVNKFPDLVEKTRALLLKTGKPFMIENVQGAPIRKDLLLCGVMFGLNMLRHRIFEIHKVKIPQPVHKPHRLKVTKLDNGWGMTRKSSYYLCVSGHGGDSQSFSFRRWKKAMGINWIVKITHLTQMIPPAYSRYIGTILNGGVLPNEISS